MAQEDTRQSIARYAGWILRSVLLCLACGLAQADVTDASDVPQSPGLMWNRTGLPAVFPLRVQTPGGQDYYLTLSDAETGAEALAAYIEGGAFFKVLVPPGTFHLRLVTGRTWQGEDRLFGPGAASQVFALARPLTFEVRDFSTKAGHVIDIAAIPAGPRDQMAKITVRDALICQTVRLERFPRLQRAFDARSFNRFRLRDDGEPVGFPSRYSTERLLENGDRPVFPTRYAPYFSLPTFEVRPRPC